MRIRVDHERCAGHARCFAFAPGVFLLDEEGYIALRGSVDVDEIDADAARRGVSACPEQVFTIEG